MIGRCPICDAQLQLTQVEESEVVVCSDCGSRLVVEEIRGERAVLVEAPEVEEDWGE